MGELNEWHGRERQEKEYKGGTLTLRATQGAIFKPNTVEAS